MFSFGSALAVALHARQVSLLAHQGGWDEIALVGVPLIIFGGLLFLANRRAKQAQDRDPE